MNENGGFSAQQIRDFNMSGRPESGTCFGTKIKNNPALIAQINKAIEQQANNENAIALKAFNLGKYVTFGEFVGPPEGQGFDPEKDKFVHDGEVIGVGPAEQAAKDVAAVVWKAYEGATEIGQNIGLRTDSGDKDTDYWKYQAYRETETNPITGAPSGTRYGIRRVWEF